MALISFALESMIIKSGNYRFCKHESELLVREYRPWVPIGRTLVSRPKMFYMDETLFNLDVMVRGEMRMEGNHTGAALEILVVQG